MSQTVVIYKSHYGSSRQYAAWIAEAVGAKLVERRDASLSILSDCDTVVYVGGLYAGSISGFSWLRRHYGQLTGKALTVVAVGAMRPTAQTKHEVARRNLTEAMIKDKAKVYLLHGAVDYPAMSPLHRLMMEVPIAIIKRKPPENRNADDQAFLDAYGKRCNYVNRDAVIPIILSLRGED